MSEPCLENLPSEIILQIFSNFDYKDLVNCSYLNRRFHELSSYPARWKELCQKYWLVRDCPTDFTWKELFMSYYMDMGRYIECYASIQTSWQKIMEFMYDNCPKICETVKDGISEEDLNIVENLLRVKLPNDLRCSYRIHNGQMLSSLGLMGNMNIHTHHKSENLLDMDAIVACDSDREGLRGCIPVTFCIRTGTSQYLAVTDEEGYDVNTVFYLAGDEMNSGSSFFMYPYYQNYKTNRDAFITARSFEEWLANYATFLEKEDPEIIQHQPYLFYHDPACIATTGLISVSVATCFMPELSKVNPPEFFHTYRITMSMPADAPLAAYQLETRHWTITDECGRERKVSGNGVVGQYPVLVPGTNYSWTSCTSFSTTYGNMKGYFMFRNVVTGDRLRVECPIFHVKSLPYITAEARASNREAKRKKENKASVDSDAIYEQSHDICDDDEQLNDS